jgi:hypothetical protein
VAEPESLARHLAEGRRVVHQPAQHPRPALCRLVEENDAAVLLVGERLGGQLGILELIADLEAVLSAAWSEAMKPAVEASPCGSKRRRLRRSST